MILQSTSQLGYIPSRIVSLVPSQTELLHDLGLEASVAGITKFCIHPGEWFRSKTRVGGTKQINCNVITSLQPDLIIANKEENVKEQVEDLAADYPVWVSDIQTLDDALAMIADLGALTGTSGRAESIIKAISTGFAELGQYRAGLTRHSRTAYFIWRNPYMTAGGDTFIHDMLKHCGLDNVFSSHSRYPETNTAELQRLGCDLLLLSSEPYPFRQQHIDELQEQLPDTRILLVDGEMFSWYGSRLRYAADYFRKILQEPTIRNS